MEKFDLVVIGAGPGGYPAAIRAAQLGASVAIVEKEQVGGTCLNWGCIPTKFLIAAAELCTNVRAASSIGIVARDLAVDYAALIRRKNEVLAKLRGGVEMLLKGNAVRVYRGEGSFLGRNRIQVAQAEGTAVLDAGAVILATGSVSAMPAFLPRHPRIVESRSFLDLAQLPASVLVLGGGVIGCEFACLLAPLGVRVTVVEMLEDIVAPLDADVRRELRRRMEGALGVRFITRVPLQDITSDDRGVSGTANGEKIEAELLLAAVGRSPCTKGLHLEAAGLQTTKAGRIEVDDFCQTAAATVYAIGDVTPGIQLAHRATSQGITAAANACGKRVRAETVIPSCIFTSPEIGSVGLSEQDAKAGGLEVRVGKFPFIALGKAVATGHTEGFVKWLADAKTGQLVGAHAVGAHATDLIAEAGVAIRAQLTAEEVARTVHAHPTLAEAWVEAAESVHGACIHLPQRPTRRPA